MLLHIYPVLLTLISWSFGGAVNHLLSKKMAAYTVHPLVGFPFKCDHFGGQIGFVEVQVSQDKRPPWNHTCTYYDLILDKLFHSVLPQHFISRKFPLNSLR